MKKLVLLLVFISFMAKAQVPVMGSINGASVVCSFPMTSTIYSVLASNSPTSYSWSVVPSSSVVISNNTNSATAITFPYSATTYTIYCSASNSVGVSVSSSSFEVIVNETPTAIISGSNSFCQNSSTNLTATASVINPTPTVTYSWAPNAGLNTTSGSSVIANPNVTTIYTITATKGLCQNTTSFTVTPVSNPTIYISSSNPDICANSSITINANGADTYTWSNSVIASSISVSSSVTAIFGVIGTDTLTGCTASASKTLNVGTQCNVSIGAPSNTICSGQSTPINAGVADNFSWSCSPYPCSITATTINHSSYGTVSPTITTTYIVSATSWFQTCPGTASKTIYVVTCNGVKEFEDTKGVLNIYPNPANDILNVELQMINEQAPIYNLKFIIYNSLGQIVQITYLQQPITIINIKELANGIYFLQLYDKNKLVGTTKIIKE